MNRITISALSVLLLLGPTSQSLAAGSMSDVQIKQKLEAEGYGNVVIKEHEKDHVDVTASKNGRSQRLAVNPRTGQIVPDTDKDNDD